jgi:hypothetical protein
MYSPTLTIEQRKQRRPTSLLAPSARVAAPRQSASTRQWDVNKMKVTMNGRLLCTGNGGHTIYDPAEVIDPENADYGLYVLAQPTKNFSSVLNSISQGGCRCERQCKHRDPRFRQDHLKGRSAAGRITPNNSERDGVGQFSDLIDARCRLPTGGDSWTHSDERYAS